MRSERDHPQDDHAPSAHEWLTEPDLRERLGYSRSTVARLRARGLPHVGRDRLRRYPWAEVRRWLAERV